MQNVALIVDEPNKNNRLYRKEVVEKALDLAKQQIKDKTFFVTAEEPSSRVVPINDIVATVNDVFVDGNRLVVDFDFLSNHALANAVQEEFKRGVLSLRPSGIGTLQWDYNQHVYIVNEDYEVMCFYFTYHPS